MDDLKIFIGNIIKNVRTNDTYRVIYIGNGYIGLCKINTSFLYNSKCWTMPVNFREGRK